MNKTRYAYSPSRIKQGYNEQLNLNQKIETKNFLKIFGLVTMSESIEIKKRIKNRPPIINESNKKIVSNKKCNEQESVDNVIKPILKTDLYESYSPPVTRRKRAELNKSK